ncbi:hypothetical protein FB561_1379 [Kribbella amoyensis]|uniref:LppX_LprAFG lipoprotein n=1 Tax=Kribbella amoyensis TaxID=996641 RepID=A0A561BN42_9ACTN|nr:hypothetical protein [Kribbella amoyensis]TWD80306.1 hypothetical protein FB561_1379 [Kribbella amoyensis]
MRFRRRATAAVALLPLALGLAACGGEPKPTGYLPSAPVESSTPSKPAVAKQQALQPATQLNRVTFLPAMKGAFARQKAWRTTGTMTAGGETLMTMNGFQQAEPLAMSMEMSGAAFDGAKAKVVMAGGKLYLSMPGVTPAGKYVALDLDDASLAKFTELAAGADPTKTFAAFDKSLINAKFVRTETIAGRKLDRYAVTVDTAGALKAQGKAVPAGVPKTLTYDLWLDSSRLVRRLSFDLQGVSMVMTMDEFNKPVTIKAPPASKIVTR